MNPDKGKNQQQVRQRQWLLMHTEERFQDAADGVLSRQQSLQPGIKLQIEVGCSQAAEKCSSELHLPPALDVL
jgi:uncharacterized protein affecting Mg2+/Co2+ transport